MQGTASPDGGNWLATASILIIVIGSGSLFVVGTVLAFADHAATATAAWGFAFLLTVLLLLSKFKRFKGFGFEAEMWEQKQEEAAQLVDSLRQLSIVTTKHLASLAARTGRAYSVLTLKELADWIIALQDNLRASAVSLERQEEALASLYEAYESAYMDYAGLIYNRLSYKLIRLGLGDMGAAARKVQEIRPKTLEDWRTVLGQVEDLAEMQPEIEEMIKDVQQFRQDRSIRRPGWLPAGEESLHM